MCCSTPPRSDRKFLDRVLRRKNLPWSLCLRRRISCLASGRPLHSLIVHSSAMNLSKFKMLTRWHRVGSFSCSLKNIHWFTNCACLCCGGHVEGFARSTCGLCPTYGGFVRAVVFLHALTTFENVVCFQEMMLLDMVFCFNLQVSFWTSCTELPIKTA